MFDWLTPMFPVDTWQKAWIERRMRWLADCFGIDRLLNAEVILPTEDFFPGSFQEDEESARHFLIRLCGYMGVELRNISLDVCEDHEMQGLAGEYEKRECSKIRIARSQLADPLQLLATLAHELAHELLLGDERLSADVPDHARA